MRHDISILTVLVSFIAYLLSVFLFLFLIDRSEAQDLFVDSQQQHCQEQIQSGAWTQEVCDCVDEHIAIIQEIDEQKVSYARMLGRIEAAISLIANVVPGTISQAGDEFITTFIAPQRLMEQHATEFATDYTPLEICQFHVNAGTATLERSKVYVCAAYLTETFFRTMKGLEPGVKPLGACAA